MQTPKSDEKQTSQLPIEFMSPFPVEACLSRIRSKHNQIADGLGREQWRCAASPHADGVWRYQIQRAKSRGSGFHLVSMEGYLVRSKDKKSTLVLGETKVSRAFYIMIGAAWALSLVGVGATLNRVSLEFAVIFLLPVIMISIVGGLSIWFQRREVMITVRRLFGSDL